MFPVIRGRTDETDETDITEITEYRDSIIKTFSEQQLIDCDENNLKCNGGNMKKAFYGDYFSTDDQKILEIMVEKFRNYIFTNDIHREGVDREKYNGIKNKRDEMKILDDGTYNLNTQELVKFDRGYSISFETSYDSYTDTEYEDIAYKMSLLSDNNVYLGVYSSVPELSFYFEDLE